MVTGRSNQKKIRNINLTQVIILSIILLITVIYYKHFVIYQKGFSFVEGTSQVNGIPHKLCFVTKPAMIVDGDKLTNISNIKPADIWSTGANQCGISFRTKLVITEMFSSTITKDVQIKSVFTNLKDLMSEWHMRSLFTYSLDRLLGLYLMPETFLELIDRNKLYSIPNRIRNLILTKTSCVPVTGDHYITGITTA